MLLCRSRLFVLTFLATGIAGLPLNARAQQLDKQSYWYGFYLGITSTVCELHKIGVINENYAKDYLAGAFQSDPDIPAAAQKDALDQISKKYKQCPIPR